MHCGKKWWIREFVAPLYISFKSWLCCCSLPSVAPQQLYVIYLSSLPIKLQPPCLLCSSHGLLLQVPPVNTVSMSQNRYVPKTWDSLPNRTKYFESASTLKQCMKTIFFFFEIIIALKFNLACTKCKGSKSFKSTKKAFVSY